MTLTFKIQSLTRNQPQASSRISFELALSGSVCSRSNEGADLLSLWLAVHAGSVPGDPAVFAQTSTYTTTAVSNSLDDPDVQPSSTHSLYEPARVFQEDTVRAFDTVRQLSQAAQPLGICLRAKRAQQLASEVFKWSLQATPAHTALNCS